MNILSPIISNFSVVATSEKFIVEDNFVVNTDDSVFVIIFYIGGNFKSWFINKIEDTFATSIIYGRNLIKNSVDKPILNELGGQEKAETTLTEIYAMMKNQSDGKVGNLLTKGSANIFYVRDINNTLRAVGVDWNDDGWRVGACSVEDPRAWNAGDRVFSRNSSEA